MRINLKSKYAFGTASYLCHIRSPGKKKKKKKTFTASSSLACQAGSGEIMQYLHDGNLISSSQTDPNHVLLITSPGVGWGESRAGMQSEGRRSHDAVLGLFGQSCRYTTRSDLGTCPLKLGCERIFTPAANMHHEWPELKVLLTSVNSPTMHWVKP